MAKIDEPSGGEERRQGRDVTPGTTDDRVLEAARSKGVPVTLADPLLSYVPLAQFLTHERGRPTAAATLRSLKRNARLPVPDLQVGGQRVPPGQALPSYSTTKGVGPQERAPQDPDPARPWTEAERTGGRNYWLRSTAEAWDASRPGPGNWQRHEREPIADRIIERYQPRAAAATPPDPTDE